jgi:hypothetical protein
MEWVQIIVPSVLVIIGGIVGWLIRSRTEEYRAIRDKLREEQRKIYSDILEPYIELFTDIKGKGSIKATQKITSYDYRKTAFELNLVDEVVSAYNTLMQHAYKAEETGDKDPVNILRLWGYLLLEIRRSLGYKSTKLNEWDMLRGMIKDIDEFVK